MTPAQHQRGGFALGFIVGLLIGLAVALGVALYVAKVPTPFMDKVPQRSAEQDAAEAARNQGWDPNAPLKSKAPMPAASPRSASGALVVTSEPAPPLAGATASQPRVPATAASEPTTTAAPRRAEKPADKPADKAAAPPEAGNAVFFVQAGAFSRAEDAEQQRAKLAMLGFAAKVYEREQSGRQVYRVRLGPFDARSDAEGTQEKLKSAGEETSLVRLAR